MRAGQYHDAVARDRIAIGVAQAPFAAAQEAGTVEHDRRPGVDRKEQHNRDDTGR